MKELSGVSANYIPYLADKGFVAAAEVVIVVSEPQYNAAMEKSRVAESFRFLASAESIRDLCKSLTKIAGESEKELAKSVKAHKEPNGQKAIEGM
jgi:hypothetical protein